MDQDFGGYMENLQKAEAAAARRAQMLADHEVRVFLSWTNVKWSTSSLSFSRAHSYCVVCLSPIRSGEIRRGEGGSSDSSRGWRVTCSRLSWR